MILGVETAEPADADMIVIHAARLTTDGVLRDGAENTVLRCFISPDRRNEFDQGLVDLGSSDSISISKRRNGAEELVPLEHAKAIFFVKTFAGSPDHHDLRFHDHLAPASLLWVRVTFFDGEVMEGTVENNQDFVLRRGFLLRPVDPDSNNRLVYVIKDKLREFQVLATRSASRQAPQ